jgi:hypothetical protein
MIARKKAMQVKGSNYLELLMSFVVRMIEDVMFIIN